MILSRKQLDSIELTFCFLTSLQKFSLGKVLVASSKFSRATRPRKTNAGSFLFCRFATVSFNYVRNMKDIAETVAVKPEPTRKKYIGLIDFTFTQVKDCTTHDHQQQG
jgi:hypothetical protein